VQLLIVESKNIVVANNICLKAMKYLPENHENTTFFIDRKANIIRPYSQIIVNFNSSTISMCPPCAAIKSILYAGESDAALRASSSKSDYISHFSIKHITPQLSQKVVFQSRNFTLSFYTLGQTYIDCTTSFEISHHEKQH